MKKIKQVAREEKIEIEKTIPLMEQPRFHSPALAHLEAHYEARPNEKFNGEASVTISTAANLRAEVEGVAREIRKLVADEKISLPGYCSASS